MELNNIDSQPGGNHDCIITLMSESVLGDKYETGNQLNYREITDAFFTAAGLWTVLYFT